MFKNMEVSIINTIIESLKRLSDQKVTFSATGMDVQKQAERITTSPEPDSQNTAHTTPSTHKDIGRNDPCWCGSGKKFKKCHGAN